MTVVKISQGSLKGAQVKTETGFEYYEFLGVPYAKPPVGNLRFKSPQPPESWTNVRDTTRCDENNVSCQADMATFTTIGSEDCLYLNVFTPLLPNPGCELLPVIVFFHGGGFVFGNGTIKCINGPDYLIEQNTVVVTVNYRLGVFGFLSLDILEAAGNMGLKDQVKALQWVRDNIGSFCGNKDKVTLLGLSAGAASIEYLILSPLAKGLFHKGILQSGSALNHWAINYKAVDLTKKLVQKLDYKRPLHDKKAIYEYLLTVPTSNLMSAATDLFMENYSSGRLCFSFVPTIEKDFRNGEAFLTASPYKLLKEGNFNRVPVIKGFCNKEGCLTGATKPQTLESLMESKNFGDYLLDDVDSSIKNHYCSRFSSIYLENVKSDDEVKEVMEDFFGDLDFVSGVRIAGKMLATKVPVYMYTFSYESNKPNLFRKQFGLVDKKGTVHGDDGPYVLKCDDVQYDDENDVLVRNRMVKMFTDFAKFGQPVPLRSSLIPVGWPQFSEATPVYLNINKDLHLDKDYEPKKMAAFGEIYERLHNCGNHLTIRSNL